MSTARTDKPSATPVFFGETARSLYEGNAAGTIVGVFSHALYVSVGGEMLSFYDAAYGEVPFGVAVYDILAFLAAAEPAVGDARRACGRRDPHRRSRACCRCAAAAPCGS